MAVYTSVDEAALSAFLRDYPIGPALSFKGIADGVENSNYLIETEKGRFILTLYEKRVSAADLPFFVGLMEHLAARGLPCPLPVKRKDGAAVSALLGRPAAIVTFLDGLAVTHPSAEHCRAAGGALGALHRIGASYTGARANALGPAGWPPLARAIARVAARIACGRHPRRSLSRQCVLPQRQSFGPHRFLFRLQRHVRLRRRGDAERLVFR
jgi:homoserine kinase type II